jgi:hypothetical protein
LKAKENKMARQVTRRSDGGEATPVEIPSLDGEFVDHKPDPQDMAAAKAIVPPSAKAFSDIQTAEWIENLTAARTVFNSPKGSFLLAPTGHHGSVQALEGDLRRDPYILRAAQREKIRFLTEEEASERIPELTDEPSNVEDHSDRIAKLLGPNASEENGLYKKDLPDEAEPIGKPQTPEEVWNGEVSRRY